MNNIHKYLPHYVAGSGHLHLYNANPQTSMIRHGTNFTSLQWYITHLTIPVIDLHLFY